MASIDFEHLPAAELPDDALLLTYRYWRALRGARIAPTRADIDPVEIPRTVLPDLMLTEVVRDGGTRRYRYRLVGSRIADLAGWDPTWQFVDTALPKAFGYCDYILGLYDALVARRQPLYSRSSYVTADPSRPPKRETHRLMLPVVEPDGAVGHVLAAQVFRVHQGVTQKPFLAPDGVSFGETRVIVDDP